MRSPEEEKATFSLTSRYVASHEKTARGHPRTASMRRSGRKDYRQMAPAALATLLALSGDLQIAEMKHFVARHHFMQIAYSSRDLRQIVGQDKLAVILGVELDDIGAFVWNRSNPSPAQVQGEIHRLYQEGIRYVFPVHVIDNYFGGTAIYQDEFARANRYHTGSWWSVGCAEQWEGITHEVDTGFDLWKSLALGVAGGNQPVPHCSTGYVNLKGLTRLGARALDQMIGLGMLIDIDHMSEKTALLGQLPGPAHLP